MEIISLGSLFHGTELGEAAFGSIRQHSSAKKMTRSKNTSDDKPRATLRRDIDENLKRVYEDALSQDIPDRFAQLLAQLRDKEAGQ